ncbi:MAG: GIY-YIG nuclease family protein [Chloroflexi bacterium]|nr:GIY-YIG nuclease family protein [Chloroflexota bacterium]
MKTYFIYIMGSKKNGTLYIGMTSNLIRRVYEHKNNVNEGFTKKYGVHILVYYEHTTDVNAAITREKQMKAWKRQWKINLIEKENPNWNDLYEGLL